MLPHNRIAGFTLVELIIGMTLSLMVMGAVLSSYVFLGRNFTRSLGISSATSPTLESQGRRALAYFTQDVRMASGIISTIPSSPDTFANALKLVVPTATGKNIIFYYYNGSSSSLYLHLSDVIDSTSDSTSVELPSRALTRVILGFPRISQVLHRDLLNCNFSYYDNSSRPYTIFDQTVAGYSSLSGIQQIAVEFSSQGGNDTNGTLTQIFQTASPRVILRNRQLGP